MLELSAKLTQTLENYGVKGDVVAIRPGPVVTMYEFAPAPGTRVNKIVNLTDDLALALEALRVRIVAPIPGKAAVGIEVPNKTREKVFLKEILADDAFRKGRAKLPMALGKDIEGGPSVVDLARMPHLLVAGTTGSGKSVAVNAMITSLLYHCSPEDVRMIMVDPKMLELSIYEGVPHLLLPVVTDPKKANLALRWAVEEMERRYDLLAQMGVRDIAAFNEKVEQAVARSSRPTSCAPPPMPRPRALEDDIEQGRVGRLARGGRRAREGRSPSTQHKLPYIVVVIDEFADLMMCAPKEVETSRRAHRPEGARRRHPPDPRDAASVGRRDHRPHQGELPVAHRVPRRRRRSTRARSSTRTVPRRCSAPATCCSPIAAARRSASTAATSTRTRSTRVVEFLKTQGRPVYNLDIVKPRDEDGEGGGRRSRCRGGKNDDDMYDKAVYIVTTTRNASISWVQRQLRIGYNRAARLVEEMEKQGVVSARRITRTSAKCSSRRPKQRRREAARA